MILGDTSFSGEVYPIPSTALSHLIARMFVQRCLAVFGVIFNVVLSFMIAAS